MKAKHHLWLLLGLSILVSCKKGTGVAEKPKEEVVVVTPKAEGLDVILRKNTTLIKRQVAFTESKVVDGVTEMRLDYINKEDQPMVLFFFKVDLNNKNITLKPMMPDGIKTFAMQSIPDMVKTNQFSGYKIVGAVNADFFDTTTGVPRGIVYMNGQAVRATMGSTWSYFGLNDTGNLIIGDNSVFSSQNASIAEALGGHQRLIKQSLPVTQTDETINPRTAVGFTANKIVYFVVADGRSVNYSHGLTYAQLAEIMKALDAKEAINLDGGGSTTFVVNTTAVTVRNRPSDGTPRKVANGWAICVKQ